MLSTNHIGDKKRLIKDYCSNAVEYVEYAMNAVECDNDLNENQNEEIGKIYEKLSSVSKLLNELVD